MLLACRDCGQQLARWAGRCPGCGGWGTIEERAATEMAAGGVEVTVLGHDGDEDQRVPTGFAGVDRVLGGGLVPGSVALLAGEPGIGKSTLLLQVVANLSAAGLSCLLASGEESRGQVASRARRLGVDGASVSFVPGRELPSVVAAAHTSRPFLLAVDSVQTLRDPDSGQVPGGPAQVRSCADALVGLAKALGVAVVLTGHVTKDGDVAGPRTLEHAVDVVLTFDGDPRSGLRMLTGGKNRFGAEGEVAWLEMTARGLHEIDPSDVLVSNQLEPGAAVALPRAGRRALAVEVQALVAPTQGPPRRHVTGLDPRRFHLVAAVLEGASIPVGRPGLRPGPRSSARIGRDRPPAARRVSVRRRGRPDRRGSRRRGDAGAPQRRACRGDPHGLRRAGLRGDRRRADRPGSSRERSPDLGRSIAPACRAGRGRSVYRHRRTDERPPRTGQKAPCPGLLICGARTARATLA